MSPKKPLTGKGPLGQAHFIVQTKDNALEVHLDRQGFRRLLRTLELLAQDGGQQDFEQSGRQSRGRSDIAAENFTPTKLTFHMDKTSAGKNLN